jgi:hypothetical protein
VKDLRTQTNTGDWLDIQKAAMSGGDIETNPIFSGALGVYNGVVMHEWTRLPNGIGANSATTRRAVFCGAQAVSLAWGQGYSEAPKYIEDLTYRSVVGEPANENCVNSGELLAA